MSPKSKDEDSVSRLEFAKLPLVEGLGLKARKRVVELLEALDSTVEKRLELQKLEEDYEAELERLQTETKRPGFRHGLLCFASQETKPRKTLDKLLLIENGCPASVINQSYKSGSSSTRRTFKKLSKDQS